MPRKALLLVVAVAALVPMVHACIQLGGGIVLAALCAFALMIGAPIVILIWLGSVTDNDARRRAQARKLGGEHEDALLWQRTIDELQPTWPEYRYVAPAEVNTLLASVQADARRIADNVAAAWALRLRGAKRLARPILGLYVVLLSSIGLSGCWGGVPPEAWGMIKPGMGTAELVAIAGGPDYVRSNGTNEVWQYCRDLGWRERLWRDEGRFAEYYTTVLVNNQTVQDIRPYPVLSAAGCQDFYRANF